MEQGGVKPLLRSAASTPMLQGSNNRVLASGEALEQCPATLCHTQHLTVLRRQSSERVEYFGSLSQYLTGRVVSQPVVIMSSASCQTTMVWLDARGQCIA